MFNYIKDSSFNSCCTLTLLQTLLDEIKLQTSVVIPLNKENVFFFESEPFLHLAAMKNNMGTF